jgi:hypothetical protein
MVDRDQGPICKIRVRANNTPHTYSNKDADNNKYPFPLPAETYANIERLTGTMDQFNFASFTFPPADFYTKVSSGSQFLAGFAKDQVLKDWSNPAEENYFSVAYFESADGQDKFLVMFSSMIYVHADQKENWEDSLLQWYGIPHDHFYWGFDHNHAHYGITSPERVKPMIDSAIARKEPINIAWMNHAMPRGVVHNRNAYQSATGESYKSLFALGASAGCDGVEFVTSGSETTGVYVINSGEGKTVQRLFDCPTDTWIQFMFFRNNSGENKGVIMKPTGHPDATSTQFMDSLALYMGGSVVPEGSYQRVTGGPVVLRFIGFAGNHVELFRGYNDGITFNASGRWQTTRWFCKVIKPVLADSLPNLNFSPLTSVGAVQDHNLYGKSASDDASKIGTDPQRLGLGIQIMRFNDMYLTACPGEAASQQGMYVRGRSLDKKVMYNAYANTSISYYSWGRLYHRSCYDCGNGVGKKGSFDMAQDVIRGINILEFSE